MNSVKLAIDVNLDEFDNELRNLLPNTIRDEMKLYDYITEGNVDVDLANTTTTIKYSKGDRDAIFYIKLEIDPKEISGIIEIDVDEKSYREIKYKPVKFDQLDDLLKEMIKNIK